MPIGTHVATRMEETFVRSGRLSPSPSPRSSAGDGDLGGLACADDASLAGVPRP